MSLSQPSFVVDLTFAHMETERVNFFSRRCGKHIWNQKWFCDTETTHKTMNAQVHAVAVRDDAACRNMCYGE